jgi:hypothetical protein
MFKEIDKICPEEGILEPQTPDHRQTAVDNEASRE